ncbi:GNAT family N-acetyltransferase [Paenibacillus alba]|uniref:GNAT family N-acetyltransferase n=1 Tax=Paenibacillus alba TaxID=1197127 RepID=A0ABU6GEK7_9BACL|nr:GNAT family N-acetyltransferase [Paenibacillus alba]MEC0232655.1 GNAT family N-acetyltransferase [Paenibacillus alba]
MDIRKFTDTDINQIVSLFYETVHSVNKRDYSQEQLDAWAPKDEETLKLNTWKDSLSHNVTYVAEIKDKIVGFSDITQCGHLDRLYIHKDFQGQGIAAALVNILEVEARGLGLIEIDTEASITAKPFFERQGYRVIQSQVVERKGVKLVNFKMVKYLLSSNGKF